MQLMQKIQMITNAVQKLKDFGHLSYLKWNKIYSCSSYSSDLEVLDEEIRKFEVLLFDWIFSTYTYRYQFPELNFYTTSQLITLRKELTKVKNQSSEVNLQLFHLLQSTVGESFDSTMLLRRGLNFDQDESLLDLEVNECKESLSDTPGSAMVPQEETIPTKLSLLDQSINDLADDERKVFNELLSSGYKDFLCLEAIKNKNLDVYSAMDWIDDLEEDEKTEFEDNWLGSVEANNPTIQEQVFHEEEVIPLKPCTTMPGEFDAIPIVSSFFNSDVSNHE